jgi:hypothetical protein
VEGRAGDRLCDELSEKVTPMRSEKVAGDHWGGKNLHQIRDHDLRDRCAQKVNQAAAHGSEPLTGALGERGFRTTGDVKPYFHQPVAECGSHIK